MTKNESVPSSAMRDSQFSISFVESEKPDKSALAAIAQFHREVDAESNQRITDQRFTIMRYEEALTAIAEDEHGKASDIAARALRIPR